MQKLNNDIKLWMTNGNEKPKIEYGFDIPVEKSIFYLKKRFFKAWANKYKIAYIYNGENTVFTAINGIEVVNPIKADKKHYGADISMFKLRIYLLAGIENPLPFYSSTILEEINYKEAYYDLINRHVKGNYRKTVTVAIMYRYDDQRKEIEVSRFKKDWKTGYINEFKNEGFIL